MSKKGMELPINMIVVVLIAVLVLVTIGAFLAGYFNRSSNDFELQAAFTSGCQRLSSQYNCADLSFPVNYQKQGSSSTTTPFSEICQLMNLDLSTSTPGSCLKACGCTVI